MDRIRILASGSQKKDIDQKRGKLFEDLMAKMLRKFGYDIDDITSRNYSGMEIDLVGKGHISNNPLYGECKFYSSPIRAKLLQEFFGKYMAKWLTNNKSEGLFVGIPNLNSHAKAFFDDNIENNPQITVRLLEEKEVTEAIVDAGLIISSAEAISSIPDKFGRSGDTVLVYSENGYFWFVYVIPKGSMSPTSIAIVDSEGTLITSKDDIEFFKQCWKELEGFHIIDEAFEAPSDAPSIPMEKDEIIEVQGSSSCFEYQFPASPEFFVGRKNLLADVVSFFKDVKEGKTSTRALLFLANSGWGKSSAILRTVKYLIENECYALSVDSRSVKSSQFIMHVINYVLEKFEFSRYDPNLPDSLTGFDGAADLLISLGRHLEEQQELLVIFLDQFENMFFNEDALNRIRDLVLKVQSAQTNIVFGFAWKTDLLTLANNFPYRTRDQLSEHSKIVIIDTFTGVVPENSVHAEITCLFQMSPQCCLPLKANRVPANILVSRPSGLLTGPVRPFLLSKIVKYWVEKHSEQIELFYLPSYSPHLNPDELLNCDLKAGVHSGKPARNEKQLKDKIKSHMFMLQKRPSRVCKYFEHKPVRYAA